MDRTIRALFKEVDKGTPGAETQAKMLTLQMIPELRKAVDGAKSAGKIRLHNRDSIIRAMASVKEKAIEVKMCQDRLNWKEKHYEDSQHEFDDCYNALATYREATKNLETECLISGDSCKGIIRQFLSFVNYHVDDCMGNIVLENKPAPLKTIPFMEALDKQTEWTIGQLDSINSQVPDSGDSQKQ